MEFHIDCSDMRGGRRGGRGSVDVLSGKETFEIGGTRMGKKKRKCQRPENEGDL